jgi:hypothetical protein
MFLILRPGRGVVNRPTRGIFEQSALKIRANARKLNGSKGMKKYWPHPEGRAFFARPLEG